VPHNIQMHPRVHMKKAKKTADLSATSLALLLGIAEKGTALMSEILRASEHAASKRAGRDSRTKALLGYYDELERIQENSARTILWRLEKKGLVSKSEKQYQLTALGSSVVKTIQGSWEEPEWRWDGKWRIVMFDIPEKRREHRERLRRALTELEYEPIQKSVFMGKRPLAEDVYEEILVGELRHCIHLLTVGEIDDEELLN